MCATNSLTIFLFQLTPPHGRRPKILGKSTKSDKFQLTPPHGRRRRGMRSIGANRRISTHASAREATSAIGKTANAIVISTHASAREATMSL